MPEGRGFCAGNLVKKNGHKKPQRPLTRMQDTFCQVIALDLRENGTQAARDAGYKGTDTALSVMANHLLKNPRIVARIAKLRKALPPVLPQGKIISSHEVLVAMSRLADSSIAEVLDDEGRLDLAKAKRTGADKLIKAITYHKDGSIRGVILYDAKGAKELMGKYWRCWDRSGYGGIEDDADKARALLAKLLRVDPKQLPPANPNDVEGELVIDDDTKVEMKNEQ